MWEYCSNKTSSGRGTAELEFLCWANFGVSNVDGRTLSGGSGLTPTENFENAMRLAHLNYQKRILTLWKNTFEGLLLRDEKLFIILLVYSTCKCNSSKIDTL